MHEDPQIPNFGRPGTGPELEEGMVLAIEPMVNAGGHEVRMGTDGWAVYSAGRVAGLALRTHRRRYGRRPAHTDPLARGRGLRRPRSVQGRSAGLERPAADFVAC